MKTKRSIFALLVGINQYEGSVRSLKGCINDVHNIKKFLEKNYSTDYNLQILTLLDQEATRINIIQQFRSHLGMAKEGDTALFHYSGHGSEEEAPPEFQKFFPTRKNQTLVCYDSRGSGGFDLADKEIAVLLSELDAKQPHIVLFVDSCHSGGITRKTNRLGEVLNPNQNNLYKRFSEENKNTRTLSSYIDGYYEKLMKEKGRIDIPKSKHIVLTACKNTESAFETENNSGVFTSSLLTILSNMGKNIHYSDLFLKNRAIIETFKREQTPQFECYEKFDPYSKFLTGEKFNQSEKYRVWYSTETNHWTLELGTIHGISDDPSTEVEFKIYENEIEVGVARAISVHVQSSEVELSFTPDFQKEYNAEMISLIEPPVSILLEQKYTTKENLSNILGVKGSYQFTNSVNSNTNIRLEIENELSVLYENKTNQLIFGVRGNWSNTSTILKSAMAHISRWYKIRDLQNTKTQFDIGQVELVFKNLLQEGKEYNTDELYLEFSKEEEDIEFELIVKNNSQQSLYFSLLYLSKDYSIYVLNSLQLKRNQSASIRTDTIHLDCDIHSCTDRFLLIASTEKIQDYLFAQKTEFEYGKIVTFRGGDNRDLGSMIVEKKKIHKNDWFTKQLVIESGRKKVGMGNFGLPISDC